jgi:hypothetical protein
LHPDRWRRKRCPGADYKTFVSTGYFGDFQAGGNCHEPGFALNRRVIEGVELAAFWASLGTLMGAPEYESAFDLRR